MHLFCFDISCSRAGIVKWFRHPKVILVTITYIYTEREGEILKYSTVRKEVDRTEQNRVE